MLAIDLFWFSLCFSMSHNERLFFCLANKVDTWDRYCHSGKYSLSNLWYIGEDKKSFMYDDIIWFDNYCKNIRLSYDIRGGQAEYSLLNLFYEGGKEKFYATSYDVTIMAKILDILYQISVMREDTKSFLSCHLMWQLWRKYYNVIWYLGGQAKYSLLNLFYEGGHIKPTATTIEQMSGECFGNVSAKKYDEREVMRIA